jgi:hypothetical protein
MTSQGKGDKRQKHTNEPSELSPRPGSAIIEPDNPRRPHRDEPGPDSPREPGDLPDQKLDDRQSFHK